jgi:glycine hydroxymethyltransferase
LVLCTKDFAEAVDKGCPAALGGPLAHAICAKAVAFAEARRPSFQSYAAKIVENSRALAEACIREGMTVLTQGTDNHLLLVDVRQTYGLSGRQAESALREAGVTLNRNSLPNDPNGPWYTSGLRLGTPATTTLGMGSEEMAEMASIIASVLTKTKATRTAQGAASQAKYDVDDATKAQAKSRVLALLERFPLYPELGEV